MKAPKIYEPKYSRIAAMQVDEDNAFLVANWLHGSGVDVKALPGELEIDTPDALLYAGVGDWVARESGKVRVYIDERFSGLYQEIQQDLADLSGRPRSGEDVQ